MIPPRTVVLPGGGGSRRQSRRSSNKRGGGLSELTRILLVGGAKGDLQEICTFEFVSILSDISNVGSGGRTFCLGDHCISGLDIGLSISFQI